MNYVYNFACAHEINCVAIFDAEWAYAVALNNSIDALQEIGLTLSNYTFGKNICTQIIQHQMYMLNFSGIIGDPFDLIHSMDTFHQYLRMYSLLIGSYTI